VQYYTSPFPGVAHWASLRGRPQRWHVKGACVTPNKKEKRKRRPVKEDPVVISAEVNMTIR